MYTHTIHIKLSNFNLLCNKKEHQGKKSILSWVTGTELPKTDFTIITIQGHIQSEFVSDLLFSTFSSSSSWLGRQPTRECGYVPEVTLF